MKYRATLAVIIISIMLGFGLSRLFLVAKPTESSVLPIRIIKKWKDTGKCQLFWADGLAIVGGLGDKIIRMDTNGKILSVVNTKWIVRPESMHCKDAIVIGQFLTKYNGYGDNDSSRGFPGIIDLNTGAHSRIASGEKASFYLNTVAYRCSYWSSDYKVFLGRLSVDARIKSRDKILTLINLDSKNITEWEPPNGGYPSSWIWSDDNKQHSFRILTTNPGALYEVGNYTNEQLIIPALDNSPIAMLSPKYDRAIAFHKAFSDNCWASDGYLVDFLKPDKEQPISIQGYDDITDFSIGWGAWSPNGKKVALLLLNEAKNNNTFELYVGDPAKRLKKAAKEGYRFSNKDWYKSSRHEVEGLPGSGSIVWDEDNRYIYCRMIEENSNNGSRVKYVIGKIDSGV